MILGVGLAYVAYRFATNEAINQAEYQGKVQRKNCYKVWITGSNPRDSHASMSGERVGIDDVFSDGFSATEADKEKKYKLYLQEEYAEKLESLLKSLLLC